MSEKKTWKLSEIRNIIDDEKEAIIMDEEYVYVAEKETNKLKVLFVKARDRYRKIDLPKVVGFIVDKLKDEMDKEKFLTELLLLHSGPAEIMELQERLEKTPKITEAPRCYSLMIGGKKGRPYEFTLIN